MQFERLGFKTQSFDTVALLLDTYLYLINKNKRWLVRVYKKDV